MTILIFAFKKLKTFKKVSEIDLQFTYDVQNSFHFHEILAWTFLIFY